MKPATPALVLALVLALGGCKGQGGKQAGSGNASGEVLPGSASDAMLPVDTLRSQPPLAPKSEEGGKTRADAEAAATDAVSAADAAPAEPATPTETPAAQ